MSVTRGKISFYENLTEYNTFLGVKNFSVSKIVLTFVKI